jgi:carbonic anhydrase
MLDMGLNRLLLNHRAYERAFAESGMATLKAAPREQVAVLTCMDARIDPARILGLEPGDAHVVRNAGGRASDDAIRSLVVSALLLGVLEVMVIQHTRCGLNEHTERQAMAKVRAQVGADVPELDFLTFTNLRDNVARDVRRIQASPHLPKHLKVAGFVYDVETGRLGRVTA